MAEEPNVDAQIPRQSPEHLQNPAIITNAIISPTDIPQGNPLQDDPSAAHLPEIELPQVPMFEQQDVTMADAAPSPAAHQISSASTPQPARTATPVRNANGAMIVESTLMPSKVAAHGAPARRYLNEKVTGILLEGVKRLVIEQPEDPLRVLGEYLLQRSRELEGPHPV